MISSGIEANQSAETRLILVVKFGVNPFSDRNESSHFLILQEQSVTCNRFFQNIAKLPGKHRCFHFK